MKVPVGKLIAEMVGVFAGYALLLFLPAGTLRWWAGWAFLAISFGCGIIIIRWLLKENPGLLYERMTGLGRPEQAAWDKPLSTAMILLYIAWVVVMPFDAVRFHWSHIPFWLQIVGGMIFIISNYLLFATYRANSYLSPVIRLQPDRGQTVISTGPYRYVRHPMYASFLVQFIGASLLLGSWLGVLVGLLITAVGARRAILEERLLRDGLPGYAEYMARVKYRLIPYLW